MRIFIDPPASARTNMELDVALLRSVVSRSAPPELRFYSWEQACVTYGRNQEPDDLRISPGLLPLVRRPSGGSAALHLPGDLAFCLCGSSASGMPGSASSLSRLVLSAVVASLRQLGVAASIGEGSPVRGELYCAKRATVADVMVAGEKLGGSAQLRMRGGALLHGSLALSNRARIAGIADARTLQGLLDGGCWLGGVGGSAIDDRELMSLISEGVQRGLSGSTQGLDSLSDVVGYNVPLRKMQQ